MAKSHGRETFVIQILNQQNAAWQGLITWTEGRQTQPFRSTLELIKLIDSALTKEDEKADRANWEEKAQASDEKRRPNGKQGAPQAG